MKPGNNVEIFDLTSPHKAVWRKFGLVLGKSLKQASLNSNVIFWNVLVSGKQHRLPDYRLRCLSETAL